ncbi:MAG: hypothetical protein COA58_09010 [Bacteroidetes bacterium]|nr:MAG: hypothetical protein COA58_09010 [Bacteroidota bacterium]
MKKLLTIGILAFTLLSCKDELNIPETNSYVDGNAPIITIVSPPKDTVFVGKTSIPIRIEVKDDYEIMEFEFDIQDQAGVLQGLNFKKTLSDTTFIYEAEYTIPTTDSTRYEVYINVTDLVGNNDNTVYFITTK